MSGVRGGGSVRGGKPGPEPGGHRAVPEGPVPAPPGLPAPAPVPTPPPPRTTPAEGLAGVGRSVRIGRGQRRPVGESVARVGLALSLAFGALAAGAGYWQVIEAAPLSAAPDNPAVVAVARSAVRGQIEDRSGVWLASSRRDASGDPYRVYRDDVVSPVIGYASRQFGTAGLERSFDAELVGLTRPDPVSDLLKKFEADKTDPQALQLTLSLALQRAAVKALGGDQGAVVIIQPRTGDVLALASTPVFDASGIANPATAEAAFERLRDDASQPLLPRATQGRYVPGSVFKIVTGLAALDSGAVTPDTTYEQQPSAELEGLLVQGFRVRDGHHLETGDEALDLIGATEVSCNLWYALAGLDAGGQAMNDTADRMGFDGQVPFALPVADSQLTNGGGPFPGGFADDVELASASYGQGETLVTPLQMALVAATVANDGVLMEPRLVATMTGRDGTTTIPSREWRRIVSGDTAGALKAAMREAVEGELGRRFTSGADIPGVEVAGKSGTAELGGEGEPHSWFIGLAPVDDPQVVIAVLVEQGGRGAERAAPIGGQLMEAALAELAGG